MKSTKELLAGSSIGGIKTSRELKLPGRDPIQLVDESGVATGNRE